MPGSYARYSGFSSSSVLYVANFAALPAIAPDGFLAVTINNDNVYAFNLGTLTWVQVGGPGAALSLGVFDSQAPDARGANLTLGILAMQSASTTNPGLVNNIAQSFSGNKTFSGTISASNLSGTNTGDVSIGISNGLSLLGQVLSLGLSSTSTTGALSSVDWNTFNNKQSALTFGNLTDVGTDGITITNGTNAVIGAGTSIAQHVADTTHNGYLSFVDWNTFNNKANNPSATSMQEVYVLANGNDATGDGTFGNPYLTISKALSTITTATATARFAVMVGPKNLAEPVFNLKPYVWIIGTQRGCTRIQVSSPSIGLDPAFATTTARCGMQNILISGANNQLNFDLQAIGGVGFSCVVEMNTVHVNGQFTWKGRTSADVFEVWQCQFLGGLSLSAGNGLLFNSYIPSNITADIVGSTDTSAYTLNHNTVEGNITFTENTHNLTAEVLGNAVTGTLTFNGSTITAVTDLSSSHNLVVSGGASVSYSQGILPIANGGTNSSAALNNNRIIQSSGGSLVEAAAITANRALASNASGIPVASTTTDTELGYVSGVTSSIQTQLNAKLSNALTNTNIFVGNAGNVATDTPVSGDINIANTGVTTIQPNVVSNAKLAQIPAHSYKGNNTGASANATDITNTQLTADLNLFTNTLQGLVPASGGGTTNFLRADGIFASPTITLTPPKVTKYTSSSGTHAFTGIPLYVRVRLVGPGGGGSGGGLGSTQGGSGTGNTTFDTLSANPGTSGGQGATAAPGGTATLGAGGWTGTPQQGAPTTGIIASPVTQGAQGGMGGSSPFGGGGGGSWAAGTANNAAANSGSGGGGGGCGANDVTGQGGSSGGYVDAIISGAALTALIGTGAAWTIGTGGVGTVGFGTGGNAGNGADGYIEVTEYYQ